MSCRPASAATSAPTPAECARFKYGIARDNVLGLPAVLPTGEIIQTGGEIAKVSTGYDPTQLIVGSEGTLALATEVIVKLHPRPDHEATVLAPFADFDHVMAAVSKILASGLGPYILEYIDSLTMAALIHTQNLELGIPDKIRDSCQAYLVVALENRTGDRLDEDVERVGELLDELGAVDVYVLEGGSAHKLIEAREKAFWTAKAIGADDIVDTVVPRTAMPNSLPPRAIWRWRRPDAGTPAIATCTWPSFARMR